jgi:hyperosmotically inducible protein
MSMRNQMIHKMLAVSLSLGMLMVAGQVLAAVDPPPEASKAGSDEPVTDTWITTKVKSELLATKHVPSRDIKVDTVNGVVTLSGHVNSHAQHEKAVATAKHIKGVQSVDASQLKVIGKSSKPHKTAEK